jgi:hypothetical protein
MMCANPGVVNSFRSAGGSRLPRLARHRGAAQTALTGMSVSTASVASKAPCRKYRRQTGPRPTFGQRLSSDESRSLRNSIRRPNSSARSTERSQPVEPWLRILVGAVRKQQDDVVALRYAPGDIASFYASYVTVTGE